MPDTPTDFTDVQLGDRFTFNGFPVELIAVGTLRTEGGPIEIIQFQRLIELNAWERLAEVSEASDFTKPILRKIVKDSLDLPEDFVVSELNADQCEIAILAIESAMVDREQLESEKE